MSCRDGRRRMNKSTVQHELHTVPYVFMLRTLLAAGAALRALIKGGDFPQAYVNADMPEEMFCYPPKTAPQYDDKGRRLVWKVIKGALRRQHTR